MNTVRWDAEIFPHLCIGDQSDRAGGRPRRHIYPWVLNRQRHLKQSVVESLVAFLDAHFVAMWIATRSPSSSTQGRSWGQPRPIVIAIRLNDERISFPPADSISQVSRNRRIRRKFAAVSPDVTPGMAPLKEL